MCPPPQGQDRGKGRKPLPKQDRYFCTRHKARRRSLLCF
nr:MAG TPA: hypothetical protein [Caudoviricetes sp.]